MLSIIHRRALTRASASYCLSNGCLGGVASSVSASGSGSTASSSSSISSSRSMHRHRHTAATTTTTSHRGASPLLRQHQQRWQGEGVEIVSSLPISFFRRTNFSYAGPRKLSDILKSELLVDKSSSEISDLWMTYHENKEMVHGLILDESKGKSVLSRAALCPFFIHPIFRDEGHFMLLSQFQSPNIFLLAFLEDYRMDPSAASPLITISIFDELSGSKGVTLVRCDIINRGISEEEGYKICKGLLEDYSEEDSFGKVHMFNKIPEKFDADKYVEEKERRWKE